MRDPELLVTQVVGNGFTVDEWVVWPPYEAERLDRCYVVASAAA